MYQQGVLTYQATVLVSQTSSDWKKDTPGVPILWTHTYFKKSSEPVSENIPTKRIDILHLFMYIYSIYE